MLKPKWILVDKRLTRIDKYSFEFWQQLIITDMNFLQRSLIDIFPYINKRWVGKGRSNISLHSFKPPTQKKKKRKKRKEKEKEKSIPVFQCLCKPSKRDLPCKETVKSFVVNLILQFSSIQVVFSSFSFFPQGAVSFGSSIY